MRYTVFFVLSFFSLILFIKYVLFKYRFSKGLLLEGKIKDYEKTSNRIRKYKIEIIDDTELVNLIIKSNNFYMINTKVKISKYNNKYYDEYTIKDLFTKFVIFIILTILLLMIFIFK